VHKIDIHKLADEAKLNSFHYKLIGWVILILVLDGYDIAITGAALPAIMADLKIDSTQAGFLASASLVGMMFGTIRSSLDDGDRRRAVQSPDSDGRLHPGSDRLRHTAIPRRPWPWRHIADSDCLGDQGPRPARRPHLLRLRSRRRSGRHSRQGIDRHLRLAGVFIAAGAPVVLIPFILKYMPESLPLLVKQNCDTELREIVRKIAPNYPLQAQEQFLVPHEDEVEVHQSAKCSRMAAYSAP